MSFVHRLVSKLELSDRGFEYENRYNAKEK